MPNVEMTEAGMATAAITVERQLRINTSTTRRRQDAAQNEMKFDLVQRGIDVARLVANHFQAYVSRQLPANTREILFYRLDNRYRVGPGLASISGAGQSARR